jgi:hypothetical protein
MAADITSGIKVYEQHTGMSEEANSPFSYKEIMVVTPATGDTDDTFDITLADYGISAVKSIKGWSHTTSFSVLVLEAPTTAVSSGVLTVTLGGSGNSNKVRSYLIGGY